MRWTVEAVLIITVISYLFYDNLVVAVLLSPYIGIYIRERKKEMEVEKKRQLEMQFKDAMIMVSFSLNVGYSVENSFREAVKELVSLYGQESPIVKGIHGMVRRMDNNENVEDVLWDFARRTNVESINYFAEVFRYAKRSGGDLIGIMKNTANTIRQMYEVEQQIRTVISGKKMEQKLMSIIPFCMIAYLRLTSPELIMTLYGNMVGVVIMTVCLMLYIGSHYMSKRIVDIRV